MNITQNEDDWILTTTATLSNEEAAALTFQAAPAQVRLGAYVEVTDANGTRIGHLSSATYVKPWVGPAWALCSIELM